MLKSGKYYVGDLSYLLDAKNGYSWEDVLESTGDFEGSSGYFEYRGIKFFCSDTYHGEGYYSDQNGRTYVVGSGFIGVFPVDTFSEEALEDHGSCVVDFKNDFECKTVDVRGFIKVDHLMIATDHTNHYENYEVDRLVEEEWRLSELDKRLEERF